MERAATTASSLEAEQDSGSGPRCQDTILGGVDAQTRKKVIITKTSIRSDLHLEHASGIDCLPTATIFEELARIGAKATAWNKFSSTMAFAIICLATNQNFNLSKYIFDAMRLYKVGVTRRVEYLDDESLGAQEMQSNRGRSIEDIDKDAEVSLVDETQGRSDDAKMFDIDVLFEVSIAAPSTTAVSPPVITEVEITLAQTLAKLKSEKSKVVIQEPVQSTTIIAPSIIPKAKGITFRDAGKSTIKTPTPVSSLSIKDKGKAKMDEPEVPLKKKDQIALDEEMARNLEAQIQAELIEEERLARKKEEEANIALIES
ncbi:hypothetical protein Tco_0179721 [Tanacetum coccineum]